MLLELIAIGGMLGLTAMSFRKEYSPEFEQLPLPSRPKDNKPISKKDMLVALVMDEIRNNPSDWRELTSAIEKKWKDSYYDGFVNKKEKMQVRTPHCADSSSMHKDDAWINEVKITGQQYKDIKAVFDERTLNVELNRFANRRLERLGYGGEDKSESLQRVGALLAHEKRSPYEGSLLARPKRSYL